MSKLNIRDTRKSDYKKFLEIYNEYPFDSEKQFDQNYLTDASSRGILVGCAMKYGDMARSPIFKVATIKDEPLGFIRADKASSQMCSQKFSLYWYGPEQLWKVFTSEEGFDLGIILVDKNYARKGIASELVNELESCMKKLRVGDLFSWVVEYPENKPSKAFHDSLKFEKVALYEADIAWGIKGYKSVLYHKSL